MALIVERNPEYINAKWLSGRIHDRIFLLERTKVGWVHFFNSEVLHRRDYHDGVIAYDVRCLHVYCLHEAAIRDVIRYRM
jgi:hypothetical protein